MSVRVSALLLWLKNELNEDDEVYIDDGGLKLRVVGASDYLEVGGHSEDYEDKSEWSVYQCDICGDMTEAPMDDIRQVGEPHCCRCGRDMDHVRDGRLRDDECEDEESCAPITHCGQPDCPICKAVGLVHPAPVHIPAQCTGPDCLLCKMFDGPSPTVDGDDEPPGEVVIVPKENP